MKNSIQTLAVIMAVVVLALPAIAQQPDSETSPVAKQQTSGCPVCKDAKGAECAACPASCEECPDAGQQSPTCNAVKPVRGIAVCDKCKVFVAVSSDEQAQKIRETCAENCPYCEQIESSESKCTASAQCKSGNCSAQSCQDCPNCPSTNTFASAGPLPGSVSFVNENAGELAQQRQQLADDLVDYLTSNQQHSPDHIRQVMRMALESTADDAHRAAMTMRMSDSFKVSTTEPCQSGCTDQGMSQLRDMVLEMRSEMDMMGESMRFLARHLQEHNGHTQQANTMQNHNSSWVSQPGPAPHQYFRNGPQFTTSPPQSQQPNQEMEQRNLQAQSPPINRVPYPPSPAQLQQRVRELEQELQRTRQLPVNTTPYDNSAEQRLSASWNPQGQLQPTSWQSEPLRPKASMEMQLNPVPMRVSTMMVRQYYVGDLISPPFASSTLRLMQTIKSNVAPDSWDHASIEIVSPSVSFLVTQTPENHDKIARMLNAMRGGESFH